MTPAGLCFKKTERTIRGWLQPEARDRKERKHGNVLRLDRLLRQLCRQLHAAWLGKLIGRSVLISPFRPALLCAPSTHALCGLSSKIPAQKIDQMSPAGGA
jgi:hypothetical protein